MEARNAVVHAVDDFEGAFGSAIIVSHHAAMAAEEIDKLCSY